MKNNLYPFYLSVFGIILIIISPSLLSDGMFLDGLLYAVISKNLANGIGDFWHLHLTKTLSPIFFEHPPLAFGLQSLFFKILGDSIFVEKLYSFLTYVVTGIIIVKIWKKLIVNNSNQTAWLPLLLWITIPLVFWAIPNNMLENTMMIFTSLSVLFILKSFENRRFLYLFLAGLSLFGAFLCKGFVGLFTFSFIFWIFIIKRNINFKRFFIDTSVLFFSALLPLIVLYFAVPESIDNILAYINKQVVGSVQNVQTVETRFFILIRLFLELIPMFLLIILLVAFTFKVKFSNSNIKWFWVFLLLGLSGVIPIMISMKQRGFYILATFPLFSIAFALLIVERVDYLMKKINTKGVKFKIYKYASILIFAIGVSLVLYNSNKIGRDKDKIEDVHSVGDIVSKNTIIAIEPKIRTDWSLHGYFARYYSISLNHNVSANEKYLLVYKHSDFEIPSQYALIPLELNNYELYEKH
ncbi:MAG: ArnT family glycosyltransferase [Bacteroidales bacterium]|jgi:hypothetical protein|nr:glycosyltransferase family 39 protein [Bacteroidales bacterium]